MRCLSSKPFDAFVLFVAEVDGKGLCADRESSLRGRG